MLTILQQRTMKYGMRTWLGFKKRIRLDQQLDAYYFGYGANLSLDRFKKWNIPAEVVGTAYIENYQIKFNLPCEYQGKGFAGIEPEKNQRVWGVLFRVNSSSLKMLDILEWVPFSFYERKKFVVTLNDKTYQDVNAYVTCHPRTGLVPSKGYLDFIIMEGRKAKFPENYLSDLQALPSKTSFEVDISFVLRNPSRKRLFFKKLEYFYRKHDILREKLTKLIP